MRFIFCKLLLTLCIFIHYHYTRTTKDRGTTHETLSVSSYKTFCGKALRLIVD